MFNFNFYSSLLLIGFVQAVIYSILLFNRGKREERIADFFATGILLVGALYVAQWMLGFAGWYDAHDWRTTLMFYVKWGNLALLGPFIWFYFRSLTNGAFRWQKKHALHFLLWGINTLPAVVTLCYDVVYFRLLTGQKFEFFHATRGPFAEYDNTNGWFLFTVLFYLTRIQLVAYLVFTLIEFRKYKQYVQEEFSNAEQLNFNQFRHSLYVFIGGMFLLAGLSTLNRVASLDYGSAWNSFFVMSVIIYFASVQFYRLDTSRTRYLRYEPSSLLHSVETSGVGAEERKRELQSSRTNVAEPDNSPTPSVDPGVASTEVTPNDLAHQDQTLLLWSLKLNAYLTKEKAYLDPDLNLSELAKQLKTNASQLSKVINTVHGQNFNDFINQLRCAEFMTALEAGQHRIHTLLSLALDSGFNSKATFNRAFKKCYGISPSEAAKRY